MTTYFASVAKKAGYEQIAALAEQINVSLSSEEMASLAEKNNMSDKELRQILTVFDYKSSFALRW